MKQAITWIIALAFGGLGGAAFTQWYINRSTVIQYSINKSVLGTDQTTVVPNFHIQVGDAIVRTLYIYTIKIQHSSGPELENAKIGIKLTPRVNLIGTTVTQQPGEALDFSCDPFKNRSDSNGLTCQARRLNGQVGAYSVSFAADSDAKLDLSIDAKNTRAVVTDIPGPGQGSNTWEIIALAAVGFASVSKAIDFAFDLLKLRRVRQNDPT